MVVGEAGPETSRSRALSASILPIAQEGAMGSVPGKDRKQLCPAPLVHCPSSYGGHWGRHLATPTGMEKSTMPLWAAPPTQAERAWQDVCEAE